MSNKSNPKVRFLWHQLRESIVLIKEDDFIGLLDSVKKWLQSNKNLFSRNLLQKYIILCLLLEDKIYDFPMNIKTAGQHLKFIVFSDVNYPRTIENILETLELAISQFAVFTNWEDCPVCQEGYLEYWKNIHTNEWVLYCPECGWQQDINGDDREYEQIVSSTLVPISKKELKINGLL